MTRKLLLRYLRSQWHRVAALGLLLGGAIVLPLTQPQIVRAFIDSATSGAETGHLIRLALLYIGLSLAVQVMNLGTTYQSAQVGWSTTNAMRADLARHSLGLDMPFHNKRTPGEMIERVDGDVTALSNFFSQFVMNVVWSVLMLAGVLALVWREDWRLGAGLLVYSIVATAVLMKMTHLAVPSATAERESFAHLFGFLEERLQGIEDVRANGAGGYVMRRFHQAASQLFKTNLRSERMGMTVWSATTAMFSAGTAIVMILGATLAVRGAITVGTVFLLYQYMQMLTDPIQIIGEQLRDFQKAAAGARRATELFDERPVVLDEGTEALPAGPLSISLEAVRFGYGDVEPVLDDVSLHVPAGEVIGVLGRTGSGKTTLARLLLRLYDIESGTLRLGDVPIAEASLSSLRHRVGYVTQDVQLFGASVKDNLTLFDSSIPQERILEVLGRLGLLDWYWSLPDGLETMLASGGASLSAGEAQLLAFARVFLRDPGLVILDEASSRLDPATERAIEHAVDALLTNRTGVLIAHRLATVQRADWICVLEGGRVAEFGRRVDLVDDPSSRFSNLLRTGLEEVLA